MLASKSLYSAFSLSQSASKQDKTHPFHFSTFKNLFWEVAPAKSLGTKIKTRRCSSIFLEWLPFCFLRFPNPFRLVRNLPRMSIFSVPSYLINTGGPVFSSSISCSSFLSPEKFFEIESWENLTLLSLALKVRSKCWNLTELVAGWDHQSRSHVSNWKKKTTPRDPKTENINKKWKSNNHTPKSIKNPLLLKRIQRYGRNHCFLGEKVNPHVASTTDQVTWMKPHGFCRDPML